MGDPAIPNYLSKHLSGESQMPPGHRFGLYFPIWNRDCTLDKSRKKDALKRVMPVESLAAELLGKIQVRQNSTAEELGELILRVSSESLSPFLTGVGMEHPVENGFAFLTPYGLPYLPGSSVKGVLRKAAEELALGLWGDREGWDIIALWQFFGFEASSAFLGVGGNYPEPLGQVADDRKSAYLEIIKEMDLDVTKAFLAYILPKKDLNAYQQNPIDFFIELTKNKKLRESVALEGALSFWDVFPTIPDDRLGIDILNPHHSGYYQKGTPPADCESPKPVFFLTVPPGSQFVFNVQCDTNRLQASLQDCWKDLLRAAFRHAFSWLGFGAKTAVGYGQLKALDEGFTEVATQEPPEAPKSVNPEEARTEAFERFCQSMPDSSKFPGRASELIQKIEGFEDPELKKMCVKAVLDIAQSSLKNARKKKKPWATAIVELCNAVGIEL